MDLLRGERASRRYGYSADHAASVPAPRRELLRSENFGVWHPVGVILGTRA